MNILAISPLVIGLILLSLFGEVHLYNFLSKVISGNMEEHGQPFDTSSTKEIFRSMGLVLLISILVKLATSHVQMAS